MSCPSPEQQRILETYQTLDNPAKHNLNNNRKVTAHISLPPACSAFPEESKARERSTADAVACMKHLPRSRAAEMFGQFFLVLHITSDIALRVLMPLYSHFLDTARFTSIEIEMLVVAKRLCYNLSNRSCSLLLFLEPKW
jgi:hypothetical protein